LLVALLLTASAGFAADRWAVGLEPQDRTLGYIALGPAGFESLSGAISQFPTEAPGARLSHLSLGLALDRDATAQREIMEYLRKNFPKELSDAMSSAGNLHNPAMTALRKPYQDAVMATAFVGRIRKDLAKIGYTVTGISTEKLVLLKEANSFSAVTWLATGRFEREPRTHSDGWATTRSDAGRWVGVNPSPGGNFQEPVFPPRSGQPGRSFVSTTR